MAKGNAKKNWAKNQARMRVFRVITFVVNALYILLILYRNGGLPRFRDVAAMLFWGGQEYLYYRALATFAKPVFDEYGDLLDCPDASSPQELGYYSFAQDALWVCWVVQTLCNLHSAFIVFYLPVPATVIYKAWTMALKPLLASYFGGGGGGASDADGQQAGQDPRNRRERRLEERQQRKARK